MKDGEVLRSKDEDQALQILADFLDDGRLRFAVIEKTQAGTFIRVSRTAPSDDEDG